MVTVNISQMELENLLEEFFNPSTTNARKQAIDSELMIFRNLKSSWSDSLHFLENVNNQYLQMFCLGILENTVTKQWISMKDDEKKRIRSALYHFVTLRNASLPIFIRNKLVKIIVDIARHDWPHFFPNFFANINTLVLDENTRMLGISFIHIFAEELVNNREDINVSRKEDLKRLFLQQVPDLFTVLVCVLCNKFRVSNSEQHEEASLRAITQLFSWVPLSNDYFTNYLLVEISQRSLLMHTDAGVAALSAFNEILYKTLVPSDCSPIILSVCRHATVILQTVLQSTQTPSDSYLTKVIEMIFLITASHWHRVEADSESNTSIEILTAFHSLTFRISADHYFSCLNVWANFLNYLLMQNKGHVDSYKTILMSLVEATIGKLLQAIECDTQPNEEGESERGTYFEENMVIIEKLAQILPTEVCATALNLWGASAEDYVNRILKGDTGFMVSSSSIVRMQHLTVATYTVANLHYHLDIETSKRIVDELSTLVNASNIKYFHLIQTRQPVPDHFLQVHCELVSALRSCLPSLTELEPQFVVELLASSLPFVLKKEYSVDARLQLANAHLIAYLIKSVGETDSIKQLFENAAFLHLPNETRAILQSALFNWVIALSLQPYEDRLTYLQQSFEDLINNGYNNLKYATTLLQCCKPFKADEKKIVYVALKYWLEKIVKELPECLRNNERAGCEMMEFFVETFRILQDQMQSDHQFMEKAVKSFVACYLQLKVDENKGVEKLLNMLTLIMEHPGAKYKYFMESLAILCIDHIAPAATQLQTTPNILTALFKLLHCVLMNKWKYFFSSKIIGAGDVKFVHDIIKIFGWSLTQPDVSLFAQNLKYLEEINKNWKLYHTDLFSKNYLHSFVVLLINTLLDKSHDLLSDDIRNALFSMAEVNFKSFYSEFLPYFLSQTAGLDDSQRIILHHHVNQATDSPTFSQNLTRLVNDIRCYRLCNGFGA